VYKKKMLANRKHRRRIERLKSKAKVLKSKGSKKAL